MIFLQLLGISEWVSFLFSLISQRDSLGYHSSVPSGVQIGALTLFYEYSRAFFRNFLRIPFSKFSGGLCGNYFRSPGKDSFRSFPWKCSSRSLSTCSSSSCRNCSKNSTWFFKQSHNFSSKAANVASFIIYLEVPSWISVVFSWGITLGDSTRTYQEILHGHWPNTYFFWNFVVHSV